MASNNKRRSRLITVSMVAVGAAVIALVIGTSACSSILGIGPPHAANGDGGIDASGDAPGGAHVCVFDTNAAVDQFDNSCVFGP